MDSITHGLTGWLLARAIPSEAGRSEARAAVVVGSVLPDADLAASLLDNDSYLRIHRGFSHSLLGVMVTSFLIAWLFHRFGRWRDLKRLYASVLIGQLLHIGLDLLNAYGTQIFQPFSDARVSFDLLFVVDFIFSGIVVAGLALSRRRAAPARIAFLALAGYIGVAAVLHMRAEEAVRTAAIRNGLRVESVWAFPVTETMPLPVKAASMLPLPGSLPVPAGPLAWNGIVDDGRTYLRARVDPFTESVAWRDRAVRGRDAPEARSLMDVPEVRTYLWFARFPVVERTDSAAGTIVTFCDLRYESLRSRRPFLLQVIETPGRQPRVRWGEGAS